MQSVEELAVAEPRIMPTAEQLLGGQVKENAVVVVVVESPRRLFPHAEDPSAR